ncbi:MAG: pterin dehydratase [Chloroflexi bacterium AL-W]|nr:pterin dehydratase [Chloroflexi bacterium AL-N1]NOK64593.1 pterin dehydratase [Chloroflexi bacterium AL-N10]NOK75835.1 pterin dehydratase [Chloroflexi bacterium AL-N5]NOK80406.1 pterin dehydratase [Chloroflexi bacterium AL-W]NOK86920.1 pterin dehydratase [Chloroflexi bacterium AL-N15]
MAEKLSDTVIQEQVDQLGSWRLQGNMISKIFQFSSFPAAVAFVTHVAFLAEAAGHHPDVDIRYNKVMLVLTTHDAGGLTQKDFSLAAQVDEILG